MISDLNGSYGSVTYEPRVTKAIQAIVRMAPDLVISTGDMVAGQRRPHLSQDELEKMWAAFHSVVSDPLTAAGIPLAVTPGNHDASAYSGFERERHLFEAEWTARRPDLDFVDDESYPFFYAFDLGGVRFVSLDVTKVGSLDPAQTERLKSVMQDAGDERVVFSHLPVWPTAIGRETEIIGDAAFERQLAALGVDLYLSGHHHTYYPGASSGIAYIAQACLGTGPRKLIGQSAATEAGFTVIAFPDAGPVEVTSLVGPDFDLQQDISALPPEISGFGAVLRRLDLAGLPGVRASPSSSQTN